MMTNINLNRSLSALLVSLVVGTLSPPTAEAMITRCQQPSRSFGRSFSHLISSALATVGSRDDHFLSRSSSSCSYERNPIHSQPSRNFSNLSDTLGTSGKNFHYNTVEMGEKYKGEEDPETYNVQYLTPEERDAFKVTIDSKSGLLLDSSGQPLSTIFKEMPFVMDEKGNLYINSNLWRPPVGTFRHSSFLAGKPVAAAGTIGVRDGIIYKLNNNSGHYRPSESRFQQIIEMLERHGIKLKEGVVKIYTPEEMTLMKG